MAARRTNGRPVVTGLSRTEAAYHKRQIAQLYAEKPIT